MHHLHENTSREERVFRVEMMDISTMSRRVDHENMLSESALCFVHASKGRRVVVPGENALVSAALHV